MDSESKVAAVKSIAQEIITEDELRQIFETNAHPVAYDGFEPSGKAHLPIGIYRPLLLKTLLGTGVKFKLLLADSFAWINNKVGGDTEHIRDVGKYFLEVWKAAGVPMDKVEVVWHKDLFDDGEYWRRVVLVAKAHSLQRTVRTLAIAGRKEDDVKQVAQLFYPSMQCADVFQLECDFTQLGMDQRKVNMLAREVAEKYGWRKPAVVSHKMLLGLDGVQSASASDEAASDSERLDVKMSKSKPDTCIFVHDSEKEVKTKIGKAYCPEKVVEGNPVLEYAKEIVFRAKPVFEITRPAKFGGDLSFESYAELEAQYRAGKVHPLDLKNGVASELNQLIAPVRSHFETNAGAKKLYERVCQFEVTR